MRLLWEDRAWADYLHWQTQDKKTLKRIKLMLAVAKERLNNPSAVDAKPLTAEQLAGGAPNLSHEMATV